MLAGIITVSILDLYTPSVGYSSNDPITILGTL